MKERIAVVLGLLVLGAYPALARAEAPKNAQPGAAQPPIINEQIVEALNCRNGDVVRRLEVQTKDTGCILLYTKFGKTNTIAYSRHGVDLCMKNFHKTRQNLENGGYTCK